MRQTLLNEQIHTTIRKQVIEFHSDVVDEVKDAVQLHHIVIVGMRWNNSVKKARKNLTKAGLAFHYIEYGSYTQEWNKRLALKMWTGFPTFPMIFVDEQLIGGNSDLEILLANKSISLSQ